MKHRLKWYLAFFIVFTLLGCFSVPTKETEALTTYATYHNDETAFSLEWPNGFTESISPHEDTKFTAIHRDGRVCVQVTVTPMTSSLTTKEKKTYMRRSFADYASSLKKNGAIRHVRMDMTKIQGEPCAIVSYEQDFSYGHDTVTLSARRYLFVGQHYSYVITTTVDKHYEKTYKKILKHMVETFHIDT